jgi:hypothetical protein
MLIACSWEFANECHKVAQDAKLADQGRTISRQGERIERLEEYVGQVTRAVSKLHQEQGGTPSSPDVSEHTEGTESPQDKPRRVLRLPTDAENNVIAVTVGGVVTELACHLVSVSPETASLAASGTALGAGVIAVLRERRREKNDADDRPCG